MIEQPRVFLQQLFTAVWQSASPDRCLPDYLDQIDHQSIVLLALGKSATQMAAVASAHYGERIRAGLAVTAYNHSVDCSPITALEAAHPVPDNNSLVAARQLMQLAQSAQQDDLVLMLLSGGGSSLACAPLAPLDFAQKQDINRQLLVSGASIDQMNSLRKHVSAIKGGRLTLKAQPARVHTLAISDVPAESPQSIASGPTMADDSSCKDCLDIIDFYQLQLPDQVINLLRRGEIETAKPHHPAFSNSSFQVIASPQQSLNAAEQLARQYNIHIVNLGADYYQDAKDIAQEHCDQIANVQQPTLLLSGGEASVTVTGQGEGGRNGQFLLSLACQLDRIGISANVWAIACDTDGIDGRGDNAGCLLTPDSLSRARSIGLDPEEMLADNNSYPFFSALNDLVITGPTGTNVNDFRAVLVLPMEH